MSGKIDGRKLRSDIKGYLKKYHPDKNPHFTVRSIVEKSWAKRDEHVLEVRFSEVDDDAVAVYGDVGAWVIERWWPQNKGKATMSKKVWSGLYLPWSSVEVEVDNITVGLYGWTHA